MFKKYHLNFFFKETFVREKLCQDPHALRIACAIEGSLDNCCVSWRGWAGPVHVHSIVIDLGRGTSAASRRLSLLFSVFFFKKTLDVSFSKIFLFLSLTLFSNYQVFSFFFENYLLHLFIKKIIAQKPLLLFIPLLLFSCFLSFFFLSSCFVKGIWWQRTIHVIKRNEWRQWWEWSPRSEKEVSCWLVFEHDNQPSRMLWLIIPGWFWQKSCVSSGWVTCGWHRLPAGHPQVNAYHHILMFSLSFFLSLSPPVLLSLCLPSLLNTWQKVTGKIWQLVAVKLNLEDFLVCVED